MLKDLSIVDYLAKTACGDPVPGGGSSAALNAALAAALVEMVANLTIGRKGFEAVDVEMRAVVEKAAGLRSKLTADVDRDSNSYAQVLKAFGRAVISKGNPNAASDGAAGVLAARMAARTAVYNVRINLGSIKDKAFISELRREAERLEADAEAKEKEILSLLKI
ncbi:MAG: methenyltetrahydrofolate cyclohydrolase [Deltaproteobacteria bacterium]|nr:methenyltetrahydrofolate cyclohydrolase [Deltaproteobacteria bacterium]